MRSEDLEGWLIGTLRSLFELVMITVCVLFAVAMFYMFTKIMWVALVAVWRL